MQGWRVGGRAEGWWKCGGVVEGRRGGGRVEGWLRGGGVVDGAEGWGRAAGREEVGSSERRRGFLNLSLFLLSSGHFP